MVIFCALASHTALHARGSMQIGRTRWLIILTSMTTDALLKAASTSPFSPLNKTPRLEPVSGYRSGAPFSRAASGSTTTGSGS